jgi:hypothetical protein
MGRADSGTYDGLNVGPVCAELENQEFGETELRQSCTALRRADRATTFSTNNSCSRGLGYSCPKGSEVNGRAIEERWYFGDMPVAAAAAICADTGSTLRGRDGGLVDAGL